MKISKLCVFTIFILLTIISFPFSSVAASKSGARSTPLLTIPAKQAIGAAAPLASSGPGEVSSYASFPGLNETDGTTMGASYVPPDVQVAVGPSHVMEMVNLAERVFSKSGIVIQTMGLNAPSGQASFFKTSDILSDPKVVFDAQSQRWFASILDLNTGSAILAVSSSSDPTAAWTVYPYLMIAAGSNCPDQPILGLNDDKIVVSSNDFKLPTPPCSGDRNLATFVGAQYWAIKKSDLTSGVSNPAVQSFGPDGTLLSAHPVHSTTSTLTEYMIGDVIRTGPIFTGQVDLISLTGIPPNIPSSPTKQAVSIQTATCCAPAALQPVTSDFLDTGDIRVRDASFSNGKIWFGFDEGCNPNGDTVTRSCFRLAQIDPTTSPIGILQDFDVGAPGQYYFYPSFSTDGPGNLDIVYGYSSTNPNGFPNIAITGQGVNDPSVTLASSVTVRQGTTSNQECQSGATVCRYGDYFGAAADPSDPSLVWVAGEYYEAATWSTWVASIRVFATSFTYSPSSPRVGQSITFVASVQGGSSPFSFAWSFSDGSSPGSGNPVNHAFNIHGTFKVTLNVTDAKGFIATSSQFVTANPIPLTVSITYTPSSPALGQVVSFTAFGSGGQSPYTYTWNFGDGSASGVGSPVNHSYSSAGTYAVTVTNTDFGNNRATATVSIIVGPNFGVSANPSSMSLSLGGVSKTSNITLTSLNGFAGTVALSTSVYSPYPGYSLDRYFPFYNSTWTISGGSGSVTLTVQPGCASTTPGTYTVTVTGRSSNPTITHSANITVTVTYASCGGGGSVASGTLITLADGSQMPVQNLAVGMQLLSYNTTSHQYVITTINRFTTVTVDNLIVIQTGSGPALRVDRNPAQKVWVKLPDGTIMLMSVTNLQVGYDLYQAITQTWVPITGIGYVNHGKYIMYDIYTTAPGNYIANGYLDPNK